jgi:hypothetical protein
MCIVDENCRVEIYIQLSNLTRNRSEKCNFRSLAGIEPAALRFRCFLIQSSELLLNVIFDHGISWILIKAIKAHCLHLESFKKKEIMLIGCKVSD